MPYLPEGVTTNGKEPKQWDAKVYDGSHQFVWRYGEELLELLSPRAGDRILDLGCGTGHLTNKIAETGAEVVGLDVSGHMVEQARSNYPGLQFIQGDGRDFQFDSPFNAVFSNAAIHWMDDPGRVARSIWNALEPEGRFVAEFGGKGNLLRIRSAIYNSVEALGFSVGAESGFRYYPTIGEYATLLESEGFTVTYARHFERPTPLEGGDEGLSRWMDMFADSLLASVPEEQRSLVVRQVEKDLREVAWRDGAWFADYKRIRVVAIKESRKTTGHE